MSFSINCPLFWTKFSNDLSIDFIIILHESARSKANIIFDCTFYFNYYFNCGLGSLDFSMKVKSHKSTIKWKVNRICRIIFRWVTSTRHKTQDTFIAEEVQMCVSVFTLVFFFSFLSSSSFSFFSLLDKVKWFLFKKMLPHRMIVCHYFPQQCCCYCCSRYMKHDFNDLLLYRRIENSM